MNSVILIGNLTRDPELRYATGGSQTAVCRFTVAVNERRRNPQTQEWEDNPSFIPVVVFGKQAENCDRYLAKGRKVAVQGRIQTGSYTNKEGNKVYTTDVIANNVEFLSPRNEGGQGSYGQNQGGFGQGGYGQGRGQSGGFPQDDGFGQGGGFQQGQSAPQQDQSIPEGFQALQDDDIPF